MKLKNLQEAKYTGQRTLGRMLSLYFEEFTRDNEMSRFGPKNGLIVKKIDAVEPNEIRRIDVVHGDNRYVWLEYVDNETDRRSIEDLMKHIEVYQAKRIF